MLECGSVLERQTGIEISLIPFFFIFTSNLGAKYIRPPAPESTVPATDEDEILRKIRSQFKPRFLDCIDRIII
jgi:ATP-dependent Clp protease ATP-binding subunit ClpA